MDWTGWNRDASIARQRNALLPIVAMIAAMAGLASGKIVETLPRHVCLAILALLRPAESCVRRLIAIVAQGLAVPEPKRRTASTARNCRKDRRTASVPAFPLFDPRKNVDPAPRQRTGSGPRILFFDGLDEPARVMPVPMPDDPIPATRICQRILALQTALNDLSKQAQRLVRALARPSCRWLRPMRPGRPPGYRHRGRDPIDTLLLDCQTLALRALHPPDTS